ncbi:MAG: cyclic nucleotide-binding/CBS domain-containing protein [Acetobacteraceae bacterium]
MNREMTEIIRNQTPICMSPTASIHEACHEMHDRRIGAILVTDESNHLLGIFTGRDAVRCVAERKDPAATKLGDVMTQSPDVMPPRSTAIEALRLMRDGGFRHVPVVENGVVIGIVSRGDFRGLEKDRLDEETGLWEHMR